MTIKPKWAKSDFLVEMLFSGASGWRPIAWPDDEADAYRLLERASHEYPADILLRLRCGPDVLVKMLANGLANVGE
jgi:hypothetical protein